MPNYTVKGRKNTQNRPAGQQFVDSFQSNMFAPPEQTVTRLSKGAPSPSSDIRPDPVAKTTVITDTTGIPKSIPNSFTNFQPPTSHGPTYENGNIIFDSDPFGKRSLTPEDIGTLHKLRTAHIEPKDMQLQDAINSAVPGLIAAIKAVPKGSPYPPNLRAALWALDKLGDRSYGYLGTTSDPTMSTVSVGRPKCNIFVAQAYGLGSNTGYGPNGVPLSTIKSMRGLGPSQQLPPLANTYDNPNASINNFPVAKRAKPQIGDIVAFGTSGHSGHATISLGGNLLIYAGENDVKLGTSGYVKADGHQNSPVTYREYRPKGR